MNPRLPTLRLHTGLIVDCFAGGGGASLGIEMALGRSPDVAVNHDPEAIAMHQANHPGTRHLLGDVWDADPQAVCEGKPVALAWFSPDCTFHSKAKNGKPNRAKASKSRALAWVVLRWAKEVKPACIILENVEEFEHWGPLTVDGRPDKRKRGFTFRRWWQGLERAGYQVEMRQLRAHDYGAPTIRKRLFVIARSDGQPIVWPEASHGPGRGAPHRAAAECIEWSIPCPSIFGRKKPLADKTLRRIARGVMRYVVNAAKPFLVPTAHAGYEEDGVTPRADERVHSIDEPLRTITAARRGDLALVAPVLVRSDMHQSNSGCAYSAKDPLRTITTAGGGGHALVGATLVQTGYGEREGQAPRCMDVEAPLGTIIAGGRNGNGNGKHALVAAYLAKHNGGHEATGSPAGEPVHTVTSRDHHALVAAFLTKYYGTATGSAMDAPAPTVLTGGKRAGGHLAEVRTFLTKFQENSTGQSPDKPLDTAMAGATRFGLVMVHGEVYAIADIGMRMLAPRELFRAQGFPDAYVIDPVCERRTKTGKVRRRKNGTVVSGPLTKTAQIRCCGNSVCPPLAAALVRANVALEQVEVA